VAHNPHSRLPRLVEGIDLRSLPIGPAEAFVLSRVDGVASELEIAELAGVDVAAVAATLEELSQLGAIWFDHAAERTRSPRPAPRPSGSFHLGPIVEAVGKAEPHHPAAALYDPRELEEAVDIEEGRKRTILDTFYGLDNSNHYQLLKVEPTADKRAIKNAYYEIVNVFHPDRYFGKNLGSFKAKLERVFARLTEAHDVLTRLAPRAEYDAYLASLRKTRDFDQRLSESSVAAEVSEIQRRIEEEARAAERAHASSPAPAPAPMPTSSVPPRTVSPYPSTPSSQPRIQSQRPLDPDARKRALARKLGGRTFSGSIPAVNASTPPASPRSSLTPSMPSNPPHSVRTDAHERAASDLKRRYEQRVTQARNEQAERYLESARVSLASKDPVSAANALRIAASLVPDDAEIATRLAEVQRQATVLLADHYLAQAQYEERDGRMAEAALSYARASVGSPTARVFERAAYCALLASGDLRTASEHARRAVSLAPEDAQARVTLARIYVTAGMKQSGLAEFERAGTLAPNDDTIKDWIRRLKRGEA